MRINTAIGEASAEYGNRDYLIRPTFAALAAIGAPEDIDHVVQGCMDAYHAHTNGVMPSTGKLSCCAQMLAACSDLPLEWLGGWRESTRVQGKLLWVQGLVTVNDLVVMANHCIKWGIMGDPRRKASKKDREQAAGLFDPAEFVAVACMPADSGGLGWTRSDAWDSTMVEFQRACEARYEATKPKKAKLPPPDNKAVSDLHELYQRAMQSRRAERHTDKRTKAKGRS